MRIVKWGAAIGFIITILTGFIPMTVSVSGNMAVDACRNTWCDLPAAGWPKAYIVDNPNTSPADSASWQGVWMGVDYFKPLAFLMDWVALSMIGYFIQTRGRNLMNMFRN